jgi:hypothetical protein
MRAVEGSTILVNGAQAADRPIDRDGFYVMGADRSPALVDIYIEWQRRSVVCVYVCVCMCIRYLRQKSYVR